eukprot:COSAG01_NODE_57068_length_314_cov_1.567442_1_plen_34_part_01
MLAQLYEWYALVGLPRAEPRRAIAAVGAWLCEGW